MKFLKRLRTRWMILVRQRKLAKHLDSAAKLKGVLSFYRKTLDNPENSSHFRYSVRDDIYKIEAELEDHELQAAHLTLRIELLEANLI